MRPSLPLVLLLCGALLRADGLSDLKAALKGLPAPAKVRVKVEAESLERESGKDSTERRTTVVEDGPEGMRILEDSRPAAAPAKPSAKTAKVPGSAKKGSGEFHDELRPAEGLLEQLEKARVMLLATVWTKIDIRRRFQRAQNRLLVLDERAEVQGSALGKSFSAKDTTRCAVL